MRNFMTDRDAGSSVRPRLGWERVDGQGLQVDRLVVEPVAVAIPQRVLPPVHVVPRGVIAACLRAAGLAPRVRGNDRRLRRLDQVVELERLDARGVERAASVRDRRVRGTITE